MQDKDAVNEKKPQLRLGKVMPYAPLNLTKTIKKFEKLIQHVPFPPDIRRGKENI